MLFNLPKNPFEVVHFSKIFKMKMDFIFLICKILPIWRKPYVKAASSFEEMSDLDKIYWAYKCLYPVTEAEKDTKDLLRKNRLCNFNSEIPDTFQKEQILTVSAVGDLFYTPNLEHSKNVLYEEVSDLIFNQDLSIANLEAPIVHTVPQGEEEPVDQNPPNTFCTPEQFEVIKGYHHQHFSVMNIANNHINDLGLEGIDNTEAILKENKIEFIGSNPSKEKYGRGKVIDVKGVKLGFISTTFGLNGKELPEASEYRINVSKITSNRYETDLTLLERQIQSCKSKNCDFIIASLHWGYEFELFPRKRQIEAARKLAEKGADAIICHHPHVIQPVEYYKTSRDNGRIVPIAYSLGSLAWIFEAPHINLSLIMNLEIVKGQLENQNMTYIKNVKLTPVFRTFKEEEGRAVTKIEKLYNSEHKERSAEMTEYTDQIKAYAEKVLEDH